MRETIPFEWEDDEGIEHHDELPAMYVVCPRCEGEGKHMNPAIDGHGITAEEWDRDWSEDEKELYFSGGYDIECLECKGKRVILVVDEIYCPKELLDKYNAIIEDREAHRREIESERRYGA